MKSHEAYIGVGSNLASPLTQVTTGIKALHALPQSTCVAVSPFYQTAPVGPIVQPEFINAVVKLITQLSPAALLIALQQIEANHARKRDIAWGPRTLDLDLLLYDDWVQNSADLTLPHPHMKERAFVLVPLLDIAPGLTLPCGTPVRELVKLFPPLKQMRNENRIPDDVAN